MRDLRRRVDRARVGPDQGVDDRQSMMIIGGRQYRYSGTIFWTLSAWASATLGALYRTGVTVGARRTTTGYDAQQDSIRRDRRPGRPLRPGHRDRCLRAAEVHGIRGKRH